MELPDVLVATLFILVLFSFVSIPLLAYFELMFATVFGGIAGYFWPYSVGFIPIFVIVAVRFFYKAYRDWDIDTGMIYFTYAFLIIWGFVVMYFIGSYMYFFNH